MGSGYPYPPLGSGLPSAYGPPMYPAHVPGYGPPLCHGSDQPLATSYMAEDPVDSITPQTDQASNASTTEDEDEHRPPPVTETLWTTIASAHKSADRKAVSAAALPSSRARAAQPKRTPSDDASASNRYLLLKEPPAGSPVRSHVGSQAGSTDQSPS